MTEEIGEGRGMQSLWQDKERQRMDQLGGLGTTSLSFHVFQELLFDIGSQLLIQIISSTH